MKKKLVAVLTATMLSAALLAACGSNTEDTVADDATTVEDSTEDVVKEAVHSSEAVKSNLEGKNIVKEIYVKNKIYNIVVK